MNSDCTAVPQKKEHHKYEIRSIINMIRRSITSMNSDCTAVHQKKEHHNYEKRSIINIGRRSIINMIRRSLKKASLKSLTIDYYQLHFQHDSNPGHRG